MVNLITTPSKKEKKNYQIINGHPFFSCAAEFSAGWQHYCSRHHLVVKVGDELRHHEAENDGVVALHVRVGYSCQQC
jgi:hypothetical protein